MSRTRELRARFPEAWRRHSGILIPALLLLVAWPPLATPLPARAADPSDEANLLKAAFVYNFAKYVHWPERSTRSGTLHLCLIGHDEIFSSLRRLQGERVHGADVEILPLPDDEPSDECDILFVGVSEQPRLQQRLQAVGDRPMLTISDIPHFAERGGVISLFHEEKKIRFAVNLHAARAAGLRISSRLLNLARIVDPADLPE
ncbi:YfiR family protein [Endothiovibrio diazotrophicus]